MAELRITVCDDQYDPLVGAIVQINIPEYNYMDLGSETDANGEVGFELPETYNEQMIVEVYINGPRIFSGYVDAQSGSSLEVTV